MTGMKVWTRVRYRIINQFSKRWRAVRSLFERRDRDPMEARARIDTPSSRALRQRYSLGERISSTRLARMYNNCQSPYTRKRIASVTRKYRSNKLDGAREISPKGLCPRVPSPARSTAIVIGAPEVMVHGTMAKPEPSTCTEPPPPSPPPHKLPVKEIPSERSTPNQTLSKGNSGKPKIHKYMYQNWSSSSELKPIELSDHLRRQLSQDIDRKDALPVNKLLKYWMKFEDNKTMQDYLEDIQRRAPRAYVLDRLKHRLSEGQRLGLPPTVKQSFDKAQKHLNGYPTNDCQQYRIVQRDFCSTEGTGDASSKHESID